MDGKLIDKDGQAVLDITVRDDTGAAVTGLTAMARLAHPATDKLDHDVPLGRIGAGAFHGAVRPRPGSGS